MPRANPFLRRPARWRDLTGVRRETWTRVGPSQVHAWEWAPPEAPAESPVVVVLPGLGLPSYAEPTLAALARRGLRCALLDLPGFGSSGGRPPRAAAHTNEAGGPRKAHTIR
jgi:alpha-beta hydrolase superfamily lysophospholipase